MTSSTDYAQTCTNPFPPPATGHAPTLSSSDVRTTLGHADIEALLEAAVTAETALARCDLTAPAAAHALGCRRLAVETATEETLQVATTQ